jgi:hypothetical protein
LQLPPVPFSANVDIGNGIQDRPTINASWFHEPQLPFIPLHLKPWLYLIAGALVAVAALAEISISLLGITNFPLYVDSESLGYIPAPNQRGVYWNGNDWVYNDLSMGTARRFQPSPRPVTLLIGDSVVNGDNWLRQNDRLGEQLEQVACGSVWPVSAGSWALLNELRYLKEHQALLSQIDQIVFVLNSGDFVTASTWSSELTHPTYRRMFWLPYVVRRYVLREVAPPSQQHETDEWRAELSWLLQSYSGRVVIALYPTRAEISDEILRARDLDRRATDIDSVASGRVEVLQVARDRRWSNSLYRDEIHPNAAGTKVLAEILSEMIKECHIHEE